MNSFHSHLSLKRTFPVLIGAIPLHNSSNTFSSDVVTTPPSSTPLLGVKFSTIDMPQPGVMLPAPPIGFVVTNPPYPTNGDPHNLPPPSYGEFTYGAKSIGDKDDSENLMGAKVPSAPEYPLQDDNPANSISNDPKFDK